MERLERINDMKNKGAFFVLISVFFCLFLSSFIKEISTYLISPLLFLFKEAKNIDILAIIFEYVLYFVVYFLYGCLLMIVLFTNSSSLKYLIIFSVLIMAASVVLFMMIRSFFDSIDYFKYIFRFFVGIISEFICFVIMNNSAKRKIK